MAEIAHAYAERTAALTNATTTFASAVSLAAGAFTAGKKYLLWVTAQTGCDSTGAGYQPELVVTHGSTDFEDSRYYYKLVTAGNRTPYAWFHVWTAVDGEGVDLKFRTGNVAATASIDQANILAVCLSDDLSEGTDWHYSEDGTDSALISITTPLDGASITFTPPSGGKDWLVVSLAQIKATNSGVSMGSRLSRTGEATQLHPEIILEPAEANNVLDQLISPCVFQLGAVSQTFKQQSLSYGSTDQHYRWHSRVFAINLSKFRSSAFAYTPDATAGDFTTTPWSTEAQTLAFTPDIEGPCWVGAYTTFDKSDINARVGFRLQVDDADAPATQTADAYTFHRGKDARDEDGLHIQALPTLTAAAHTAALDVYSTVSASGYQTAKYRLLWAVSMELAPPPASTVDIGSITPNTGGQGQTLDVALTGVDFATGITSDFGAGVTVNSTTFHTSTSLTVNITVGNYAALGARDVTVTNADLSGDTYAGGFTVTVPPLQIWGDEFTRADGALGADWTGSSWAISSNSVTTAAQDCYWSKATDRSPKTPDYAARIRVKALSASDNAFVAVGVRACDDSSGYFARIIRKSGGTDELEVAKRSGSTTFTRLAVVAYEWVDDDYLEVIADGNSVTARALDGTTWAELETVSATDSTWQEILGTAVLHASSTDSTVDYFSARHLRTANLSHLTVGAVTTTTARIAFACSHPATVKVRYSTSKAAGALVSPTTTAGVAVDATTDCTGVVDITGLTVATAYHFEILVDDVSKCRDTADLAFPVFKTAKANDFSGVMKIAFGSCYRGDGTIMSAVADKAPDLFILNGDVVYTNDFGASTLAEYRHVGRVAAGSGSYGGGNSGTEGWKKRRTRREFPSLYGEDDHEYDAGTYADVKQALREHLFRGNPNSPTSGELYFSARMGNVEIFMLDVRALRTTSTVIGATQLAWLKSALSASSAPVKVIVSGGMISGVCNADCWPQKAAYRAERDEILDHIRTNLIGGTIWFTGDRHISGAYALKQYTAGVPGAWTAWEFMSSAMDSTTFPVPYSNQAIRPIAQSGATRSGGVSTIATGGAGAAENHGILVGESVTVTGCSDSSFDGVHTVTAATDATVSYAQALSDVGSGTAGGGYIEAEQIQWQVGDGVKQFALATIDTSVLPITITISSYDETGALLTARAPGGGSVPATLALTGDDLLVLPTLSLSTYKPTTLTGSGWTPRITAT